MAELSRESRVPVATIKYYLREGLLPPGELTSPNQARYGEGHLRRLKLVRILLEVGGLSIANVREVMEAIDDQISTHKVLGIAHYALALPLAQVDEPSRDWAWSRLSEVAKERGWQLKSTNPVVQALVGALCAFRELGRPELVDRLGGYAELADRMAELDLDTLRELQDIELIVEGAVVGTVLGDVLFAALRRLAQEHLSARRYADPASAARTGELG